MTDNSALLTQLEGRVNELERLLKAPAKSKETTPRANLLEVAHKVAVDLKKLESENDIIKNFFAKWTQVEPLIASLDSGDAFLTPEVKLAILLACDENISQTSTHLQSIQELEKFINPPSLQTVPSLLGKLAPIETTHFDQKEAAARLGADVEQHILSYNSIINLLSQKFVYWDHMLTLWEQQLDKK